jgi:hypothetical protein
MLAEINPVALSALPIARTSHSTAGSFNPSRVIPNLRSDMTQQIIKRASPKKSQIFQNVSPHKLEKQVR